MSSKPEPAIWSRDTGQRISWYDGCQLHIICMSNINDICCNPRLHDLLLARWPPCCATSFVVVGRTRPWSMPLAILTIRKELHGFLFLCIRVVPFSIIMGLRLAALWAAGAPLKKLLTGKEGKNVKLSTKKWPRLAFWSYSARYDYLPYRGVK